MAKMRLKSAILAPILLLCAAPFAVSGYGQSRPPAPPPASAAKPASQGTAAPKSVAPQPAQAPLPSDYVIGADDVLVVMFRRERDMSGEVTVRPDGKVTLPLLDDIQAAGLTPEQFRDKVTEEAKRFVEDPSVTITVRQINSRKVFITGQVARPGAYPLGSRMTVVQLIAMAGGLTEYAKSKDIVILRDTPAGQARLGARPITFKFNYNDVQSLKNLASNIDLKPGDTVIVP
jgi:polysaccharide export outer membrane protein